MFSLSYSFPASPALGVWNAIVSYGFRFTQKTNITFELKEYVPPSFSARIMAPGVILPDTNVTVTVEAKYPYGRPIQGLVTCKFKTRNANTGQVWPYQRAESLTEELVNGNATFTLPSRGRWDQYLHSVYLGSRLVVEAEVLDKVTGERVTAEDDSAVYAHSPYRVSFRRTDPNFRPGAPKVVKVDVTYANGQPAALVPCTVKAEAGNGFNVPVDPDVAVTDARGRLAFAVSTEGQHTLIMAKVETLLPSEPGQQAVGQIFLSVFRSQSNAVLYLESADGGNVVKVGGIVSIRVRIYPPTFSPGYYIVTHNGQVKRFGELYQDVSSYRFARFSVTNDMSPSLRVLVYAFHEGHLLADSLVIEVEEACLEKAAITIETDFKSERPGANGSVKILGSPGTRVGILGINKQVSELASKGLLTSNKMFAKLKSHDMGCGPGGGSTIRDVLSNFGVIVISQHSPDVIHEDPRCRPLSRHPSFQRLKRSVESETASAAFLDECCSLARRSDRFQRSCRARAVIVRLYISGQKGKLCADVYLSCCSLPFGGVEIVFSSPLSPLPNRGRPFFSLAADTPDDFEIDGRIGQKPKLRPALGLQPNFDEEDEYDEAHDLPPDSVIRNDFRETWIFDERVIGLDGVADIATSLPHSITTWSVQAVSVAPSGGVCIPQPREVRAFQLFFLQVVLPYSVVRKEQIEVLATVYNYVNETIRCNVYVYGLEGVCTGTQEGERSERRAVSVSASSASSLTFPVVPLREGLFTIKVHAHCNQSSGHSPGTHDIVEKKLHVVPEGVPVEKIVAVPIDPDSARRRATQRSTTDVYDDSVDPVTNHQTISINLIPPSDAVPGTRSSSLSLTGNQLGPSAVETLDVIEVLMRRPTGSSEEIDTLMAQTLHALEYLRRKNMSDPVLEERGRRYLRDGYQQQLYFWNETGFFSESANRTSESIRLTALVARTLCKARQHISINDSVVSSAIQWLQRQEKFIMYRGSHNTRREVEIMDVFVANRALIVVTLMECMPFIEEKLLAVEMEEVLNHLYVDTRFLMASRQQTRNGHAFALAAYAVAWNLGEGHLAQRLLSAMLVDDPLLPNARSTGTDKSSKTVEGTSYALLALLAVRSNDTDTIQSLANWLNANRPSASTSSLRHDSAVSLQALMEFDLTSSKRYVDLMCNVTMRGQQEFYKSIQITPENAAEHQQLDIHDMSGTLLVTANGTGSGLLSIRMKYNVLMPPELLCKFNITVHADVHKPKPKSNEPVDFPQELLDDLLGFKREHHRTTRSSNQPQQSKLVYDIEVCSQYIGESDSNAAVIEVGLLSGFDPVVEDLDTAINSNLHLYKYLVTEKKVILYFNQIPREAASCVQFRTERKHVVHNIQSAAVKVYDYSDPSRSCTQFYGLEATSPLLKVACTGNKCQCIEAECPRRHPFLNVTSVIPEQIKRQILLEIACKEHDFVWIGSVSGNSVLNGFRHVQLRVNTVLKEGSEKKRAVLTGTKLFLAPHHCSTADLSVGEEYFVFGRDGEPFANNGSVGVRYSLDKSVRLFKVEKEEAHSRPSWRSSGKLSSVFHWLSARLQSHQGCPEHLRVVRSATFSNKDMAAFKRH
ncbi:venom factor isoform X2 [Rhipicephalus microplus]